MNLVVLLNLECESRRATESPSVTVQNLKMMKNTNDKNDAMMQATGIPKNDKNYKDN